MHCWLGLTSNQTRRMVLLKRQPPAELFYWPASWGRLHAYRHCLTAFYENPVGFGGLRGVALAERMKTATSGGELRQRRVCGVCIVRWQRGLDGDDYDA